MLCRKISPIHTLCRNRHFPRMRPMHKPFRYRVLLGVGGNIGDTRRRLVRLWHSLCRESQMAPLQSAPMLRNPPFGYEEQNDFENSVIEIATSLEPRALLRRIWRIEKRFGRTRSFRNAPRTLDLDILFFEDRVVQYKELNIPHPCWRERLSVTIPLGYMHIARRYGRKIV